MWVKFDDQTPNDPVIDELSDGAFRLWFSAICYCQAELTDGLIAADRIRRLTPRFRPGQLRELLDAGVLTTSPGGYEIRNFAKYQRDRAYWTKKKANDAKRLADWRAKNGSPEPPM